jgi:hypothetical protein
VRVLQWRAHTPTAAVRRWEDRTSEGAEAGEREGGAEVGASRLLEQTDSIYRA